MAASSTSPLILCNLGSLLAIRMGLSLCWLAFLEYESGCTAHTWYMYTSV